LGSFEVSTVDPSNTPSTADAPLLTHQAVQDTPGGGQTDALVAVLPSP
jgi:hypothetical protein